MSSVKKEEIKSRLSPSLRPTPSFATTLIRSLTWGLYLSGLGVIIWQWDGISQGFSDLMDHLSQEGGMSLADVSVEGRSHVSSETILKCLSLHRGDALTKFSPLVAKECLEKNPWIRSATVMRQYPHTIHVQIVERDPVAIWQYQGKNKLLDREGAIIEVQDASPFSHLMIVVGEKAPESLLSLNQALGSFPDIKEHVSAAIHVREERWDLKMNNGMIVKLPDDHLEDAFHQLRKLVAQYHIWERDYSILDMRLQDQLILKPAKAGSSKKDPGKDV